MTQNSKRKSSYHWIKDLPPDEQEKVRKGNREKRIRRQLGLKELALEMGFTSWTALETKLLNRELKII